MASGSWTTRYGVDWKDSRPPHDPLAAAFTGIDPDSAVETENRRRQMREYFEYHGMGDGLREAWDLAQEKACLQGLEKGVKECSTMRFETQVDLYVWCARFQHYDASNWPQWPYANVVDHLVANRTEMSEVYRAFIEEQAAALAGATKLAQAEVQVIFLRHQGDIKAAATALKDWALADDGPIKGSGRVELAKTQWRKLADRELGSKLDVWADSVATACADTAGS